MVETEKIVCKIMKQGTLNFPQENTVFPPSYVSNTRTQSFLHMPVVGKGVEVLKIITIKLVS